MLVREGIYAFVDDLLFWPLMRAALAAEARTFMVPGKRDIPLGPGVNGRSPRNTSVPEVDFGPCAHRLRR